MDTPIRRASSRPFLTRAAVLVLAVASAAAPAAAGVEYPEPDGGWDYLFDGDVDARGADDQSALDGTWRRDEATKWQQAGLDPNAGTFPGDAYAPPDNPPGGVAALLDGDTTYLRIQDPGEPRDWSYEDPSNRRFWFGRDIEREHAGATSVLTNGVTITFRARISSTGALDPVHPQTSPDPDPEQPQLTEITPWFPKGYNVTDDGQGMFTVQEDGARAVGFALALDIDTPAFLGGGLVMNNQPGLFLPGSDHTDAAHANLLPMADADLLDWHEFWITIEGSGAPGSYLVDVYRDGSGTPVSFLVAQSNGAEYDGQHIAFGLSATSGYGAVDVDFFGYRLGVVPEATGAAPGLVAGTALVALARARRRRVRRPRSP